MNLLLFLSHIHEEKDLAIQIKNALENEFSGFVDVFVSSDGVSIPAGANFLKRIEDGLVSCVGALYLLSPVSVKRPWINFELGAVWVRNAISIRGGGAEIPALPLCHSGLSLSDLPAPINNLNSIQANDASKLEFAFKSIQSAVGGRGSLRTDFDALAAGIIGFEKNYTFTSRFKNAIGRIAGADYNQLLTMIRNTTNKDFVFKLQIDQDIAKELMSLSKENSTYSSYDIKSSGIAFGDTGTNNVVNFELKFDRAFLLDRLAVK